MANSPGNELNIIAQPNKFSWIPKAEFPQVTIQFKLAVVWAFNDAYWDQVTVKNFQFVGTAPAYPVILTPQSLQFDEGETAPQYINFTAVTEEYQMKFDIQFRQKSTKELFTVDPVIVLIPPASGAGTLQKV